MQASKAQLRLKIEKSANTSEDIREYRVAYDNSICHWEVIISGPKDTIWEGRNFRLDFSFPNSYPDSPPKVKFLSPMFHPNVDSCGNVTLDILGCAWMKNLHVSHICESIKALLSKPSLNKAARLYFENRDVYNARVQECVESSISTASSSEGSQESIDGKKEEEECKIEPQEYPSKRRVAVKKTF